MKELETEKVEINRDTWDYVINKRKQTDKKTNAEKTKQQLIAKYGATGIAKNSITDDFRSPEVLADLERLVNDLKKYKDPEIHTFIPSTTDINFKKYKKHLQFLIDKDKGVTVDNPEGKFVAIPTDMLYCKRCGAYKRSHTFYNALEKTSNGVLDICKDCLKEMCMDFYNKYRNYEYTLLLMCLYTNCAYNQELANIAIKNLQINEEDPSLLYVYYRVEINHHITSNSLVNTNELTFEHSNFDGNIFKFVPQLDSMPECYFPEQNEAPSTNTQKRNKDLVNKWGAGFTNEEYAKMEQLYEDLSKFKSKKANIIQTNALVEYVRLKIKLDSAIGKGDLKDIKEWQSMADKAAKNAGIKLDQLTAEDFGEGVDSWTSLVELVEEYDSIVPIMPKVKKMCYDDIDFIIWQNVNYGRRLMELPEVNYEDVWQFIDEKFMEEMKRRGYSEKQIAEERKERNAIYKDLGENYVEPLWLNPNLQESEEEDLYE